MLEDDSSVATRGKKVEHTMPVLGVKFHNIFSGRQDILQKNATEILTIGVTWVGILQCFNYMRENSRSLQLWCTCKIENKMQPQKRGNNSFWVDAIHPSWYFSHASMFSWVEPVWSVLLKDTVQCLGEALTRDFSISSTIFSKFRAPDKLYYMFNWVFTPPDFYQLLF